MMPASSFRWKVRSSFPITWAAFSIRGTGLGEIFWYSPAKSRNASSSSSIASDEMRAAVSSAIPASPSSSRIYVT